MATGDTMSVTIMSKPNNAGYFPKVSIDGVATGITTYWSGGSAPSSAESSGVDVNVYQIIKTADATYDVLANTSNFA
jgi:predicted RecA/RadA family phage recombinase